MKHSVAVHGKTFEVSVFQKSKSVWEAVGEYTEVLIVPGNMRETIRVKGRTESAALTAWTDAARYRGK